jgi:hypothetical protein
MEPVETAVIRTASRVSPNFPTAKKQVVEDCMRPYALMADASANAAIFSDPI